MYEKDKKILKYIDEKVYQFLYKNEKIMPNRIKKLIANYYPDARIRKQYFETLGVYMGNGTYANLGMKVVVGELKDKYMIIIGDNVSIAPNVTFISESCPNNSDKLKNIQYVKDNLIKNEQIIIENDVWIGANVTILPGVIVGSGSIIGAGSIVNKDIEPNCIYAGVPAKKIRNINNY